MLDHASGRHIAAQQICRIQIAIGDGVVLARRITGAHQLAIGIWADETYAHVHREWALEQFQLPVRSLFETVAHGLLAGDDADDCMSLSPVDDHIGVRQVAAVFAVVHKQVALHALQVFGEITALQHSVGGAAEVETMGSVQGVDPIFDLYADDLLQRVTANRLGRLLIAACVPLFEGGHNFVDVVERIAVRPIEEELQDRVFAGERGGLSRHSNRIAAGFRLCQPG